MSELQPSQSEIFSDPASPENRELAERLRQQILFPEAGIKVFPESRTSANVIPITRTMQLGSAALSAHDAAPERKEASG